VTRVRTQSSRHQAPRTKSRTTLKRQEVSRSKRTSLSRIRGLTCEILAHAPTPSIPPRLFPRPRWALSLSLYPSRASVPSFSPSLHPSTSYLYLCLSIYLSLARHARSSFNSTPVLLPPSSPRSVSLPSLFVFRRRLKPPPLSLSLSLMPRLFFHRFFPFFLPDGS